jgi:hypothetical protein
LRYVLSAQLKYRSLILRSHGVFLTALLGPVHLVIRIKDRIVETAPLLFSERRGRLTDREISSSISEVLRIHRDALPHLNLAIQME